MFFNIEQVDSKLWRDVLGISIGAILAILFTMWVEYLRRPRLRLSIETPPHDHPNHQFRCLRLKLSNKPLPWWARWMLRAPALQCRGTITFHHLDGGDFFGRAMPVRWSASPEPAPIPIADKATGD